MSRLPGPSTRSALYDGECLHRLWRGYLSIDDLFSLHRCPGLSEAALPDPRWATPKENPTQPEITWNHEAICFLQYLLFGALKIDIDFNFWACCDYEVPRAVYHRLAWTCLYPKLKHTPLRIVVPLCNYTQTYVFIFRYISVTAKSSSRWSASTSTIPRNDIRHIGVTLATLATVWHSLWSMEPTFAGIAVLETILEAINWTFQNLQRLVFIPEVELYWVYIYGLMMFNDV